MRLRASATVLLLSLAAILAGPGVADAQFEGEKLCTSEGMVRWTPTTIWTPNHKMKVIDIKFNEIEQDGDTLKVEVVSISHDEDGHERGLAKKHEPDWSGVGNSGHGLDGIPPQPPEPANTIVRLRKERIGKGDGRLYTITVECTDTGNVSGDPRETGTADLEVLVPHDQGN